MPGDILKVFVGREHREVVAKAELRQQRIDRADLNAASSAFVSLIGRVHMVAPIGNQQRQSGEPFEDLPAIPRSGEALQELLQNEPGRHELLAASMARISSRRSFAALGASRRKASGQTPVSTKRLNVASARACNRTPRPIRACRPARASASAPVAR